MVQPSKQRSQAAPVAPECRPDARPVLAGALLMPRAHLAKLKLVVNPKGASSKP